MGLVPFNRVLAKIPGWRAIFIAPTKLRVFGRVRSSEYTPSVSRSLDSSLREGAGDAPIQAPSLRELARPTGRD